VFGTGFLDGLAEVDLSRFGETVYVEGDPDGLPGPT
jgi:hypothetical protein